MTMERCPACGHTFDASTHRHDFGWREWLIPRMPSTRVKQEFAVSCPACGETFVSTTLRWFGFVRYEHVPWFIGGLLVAGIVVGLLG